jgi:hypothetical protein
MLAPAPLNNDFTPSWATICLKAAADEAYLTASPEVIIFKLDRLLRGQYHTTSDSIERVRGETGTSCDDPSEEERGKEVTLERTGEKDRLERIVETKVETSVNDDTSDGRTETTVETTETVGSESLLVDINQPVELTLTT